MKKAWFLLLLGLIVSGALRSQIRSEILSFVDSTEMLVHQGRRMIINELNNNNSEKAKVIYEHLKEATKNSAYDAFYYVEDLYINLLTADWPATEKLFKAYDHKARQQLFPKSPEMASILFTMVQDRKPMILASSRDEGMEAEAWQLLDLLLYYTSNDRDDQEFNKKLSTYRKTYKPSSYPEFVKHFVPGRLYTSAFNVSLGSGVVIPMGDLSNYFSSNATFNMGMDVNVDRIFSSLYLQVSGLPSKLPLIAITPYDTLFFEKGDRFTYLDAGLKGGYFVVRNKRFHLAPYLSVSGSSLQSNVYDDPRDNKREAYIFNTFTYGAGLHSEVKLYEYSSSNIYGVPTVGYLSLKFEAGYNKMNRIKTLATDGAASYFIMAFVMGFGQF